MYHIMFKEHEFPYAFSDFGAIPSQPCGKRAARSVSLASLKSVGNVGFEKGGWWKNVKRLKIGFVQWSSFRELCGSSLSVRSSKKANSSVKRPDTNIFHESRKTQA
jgi:hypothetical protein